MTIWILIIGTMALSLFAAARVKSVYHRYHRGSVLSGVTGGEAAALILRQAGIRDVEIDGCDTRSFSAAFFKLPSFAMVRKYRRW